MANRKKGTDRDMKTQGHLQGLIPARWKGETQDT